MFRISHDSQCEPLLAYRKTLVLILSYLNRLDLIVYTIFGNLDNQILDLAVISKTINTIKDKPGYLHGNGDALKSKSSIPIFKEEVSMFPRIITYDHISSKNILHQLVEKGAEESNPMSPDLVKLNIINKIQLDEEIILSDSLTAELPSVILSATLNTYLSCRTLLSCKSKIGDKGLDEEKAVTGEGHTTKEGKNSIPWNSNGYLTEESSGKGHISIREARQRTPR